MLIAMFRQPRSSIKCQGSLEKQGKYWRWKKYWFILHEDQLIYFKDSDNTGVRKSSVTPGEIDLSQALEVKCLKSNNKGFVFSIVTKSKQHVLLANKEEIREQWVKALQAALLIKGNSAESPKLQRQVSCNSISDDEASESNNAMTEPSSPSQNASVSDPFDEDSNPYMLIKDCELHNDQREPAKDIKTPITNGSNTEPYSYAVTLRKKSWIGVSIEDSDSSPYSQPYQSADLTPGYSTVKQESAMFEPEQADDVYEEVDTTARTYATVQPKHLRPNQNPPAKDVNIIYSEVTTRPAFKPLPNARIELTATSAFDSIRLFLAKNRNQNEVFPDPKPEELGGKAIEVLVQFINEVDMNNVSETEAYHYQDDMNPYHEVESSQIVEITKL